MRRVNIKTSYALLLLFISISSCFFYQSDDIYIPASVVRVIDGDTAEMDIYPPDKDTYRASVRFRGVDTPEIRSQCLAERKAALRAKAFTADILVGGNVLIRNPEIDRYGRIAGDVLVQKVDISEKIVSAGYGRHYASGRRKPWCNEQGALLH